MTKMAATPLYGKNSSKIFSRTGRPFSTKLGIQHWGLQPIIVCSNDEPGVTVTYFRSIGKLGFSMGKSENSGFFRNIAASVLKVGRCRQLIEIMTVCEY